LNGLDDSFQNNNGHLDAAEGTVVAVYELDSLTLEPNGHVFVDTIDNSEDRFAFENIILGSPYVLIDILDSCIASDCIQRGVWNSGAYPLSREVPCNYDSLIAEDSSWAAALPTSCAVADPTKYPVSLSAIIDVRNYQDVNSPKISVNALSYLKIPLLKKNFAEGMSFAVARKKAEQDVLENFGIYEDLGEFENAENVNGELSYVLQMMVHVVRTGILFDEVLPINLSRYYNMTLAAVAVLGNAAEQVYSNTIKMLDYEIGYYAQKNGIGRCTEARENETHNIGGPENYSIVCLSNKWRPGHKKIGYSNGTMTDSRDGKTYKTVTYNWGSVTQTWMAENLNYTDASSSATCWEGDSTCESFGRYYTWRSAMDLDWSSINMTSVVHEFIDVGSTYMDKWDTVAVEKICLEKSYLEGEQDSVEYVYCFVKSPDGMCLSQDSADNVYSYCNRKYWKGCRLDLSRTVLNTKPVAHRGVCPDGWRIPNKEDWVVLEQNIDTRGASLTDTYGSGFGYAEPMKLEYVDSETPMLRVLNRTKGQFVSVPDVDDAGNTPAIIYWVGMGFSFAIKNTYGNLSFYELNNKAFVRCIKN